MNLAEIKVPSWLSVHRHAEEIMDRIDPIPTAMLPPPDVEPPPMPESPEVEAMKKAAATVARFEEQRRQQSELIERATLEIKNLRRENELLKLDLAQVQNNLTVAQSQVESFRQEASDTRAMFSSIRAQLDHFEIPLPVRKRVRNGKINEASHALPAKPVDRPTIQPGQAA